MISFIVCSKDPEAYEFHRQNVQRTAGCPVQMIRVDNSAGSFGICAAYNRGVAQATGDVFCFVHEDVFFMEEGWGPRILQKFQDDPRLGVAGVAGTTYLDGAHPHWTWAGTPWLAGRVVHELDGGREFFLTQFGEEEQDREVVALDGLCLFARPGVFRQYRFDEATFPGFHFYDLDFCLQARRTFRVCSTRDVLIKHLSAGRFGDEWKLASKAFATKWAAELPVRASGAPADAPLPGQPFLSQDLQGRVTQIILL